MVSVSLPRHPLDPLSSDEIERVTALVSSKYGQLAYNAVTLREPPKALMLAWIANPESTPRLPRQAEVTAVDKEGISFEGLVDIISGQVLEWGKIEGGQPIVCFSPF